MLDDIQLPNARTVRMTLLDMDAVHESEQKVKVLVTPFGVGIFAGGYRAGGKETSDGAPVLVNQHKGKLIVSVWADINSPEPTHQIPLNRAKVNSRLL